MGKYFQLLRQFLKQNYKTIYFNFKYLQFKQAIEMPIRLSNKVYLRKTKGKIIINSPIKYEMIQIGFKDVGIFDEKISRSIWEVAGTVIFNGRTKIGHGSKISVGKEGTLIFGENFTITAESSIVAFSKIEFGKNCLLSWDVLIMDTDFHKIYEINDFQKKRINFPKKILFGNNVWVGCRCLILKGSDIPNNCVIGANSVVSRKLQKENSIYVGNPVKLLKEEISWE